jgi:hypothetical protein
MWPLPLYFAPDVSRWFSSASSPIYAGAFSFLLIETPAKIASGGRLVKKRVP